MDQEQESTASKNTITIEDVGPCRKKVCIEIPEETIKKGRAPRRLLEKRFGKETTEQIKLKLLADASDSAIKDNKLDVLRDPDIDFEKIELPGEGPLTFDFEVEVGPEFDLPQLQGIPIEKQKLQVTDEQVDREIAQLRRWSGMWVLRKDGGIQPEDQVIADAVLKTEEGQEEKLDNIEIYVRRNGFVGAVPIENLDEVLAGTEAGQTRQTSVQVPKTYFREEYRGKKVDIQITVKDIKWLKPAELDENFLNKLSVENETELREKIRDTLENRLERDSRREMTDRIYQYLLKNTDLDLPLDVVADQAETLLRRQQINLLQRGVAREQLEQQMDQLKAGSEEQAKEQLKLFFIMDKIAEKLEVDVSEEEVNGYIAQLAIQQGQRPERMREQMMRDGSLAQLRLQVREDKCVAKLLESANITEVEPKMTPKKSKKTTKKAKKKTQGSSKMTTEKALSQKKEPNKRKKTARNKTGQ